MKSFTLKKQLKKAICVCLSAFTLIGIACTVNVPVQDTAVIANAASNLKLDKSVVSIGKNESIKLNANQNVKWRTSSSKILTVTNSGKVTAKDKGIAWITATNVYGQEVSCRFNIKNAPSKVSMSQSVLSLGVGESYSLNAIIPDNSACASRTFRTSNSNLVKMTRTNWQGQFKALKTGTAWVTVRTYNGKEASCRINVKKAPSSVRLNKSSLTLKVGQTGSLNSILSSDSASSKRTFRTSNKNIVSMTKTNWSGQFKAVKTGTAWVTVRTYNGKEASCKVNVVSNASSSPSKTTGKSASPSQSTGKTVNQSSSTIGKSTSKTSVPANQSQGMYYILNTNTLCYHKDAGCRAAKRINPENKATVISTPEKLMAEGYTPCGICS